MSDIEVIAEYKFLPSRIGFWLTMLSFPLWGILAPLFAVVVIWMLIVEPSTAAGYTFGGDGGVYVAVVGVLLATVVGAICAVAFSDNKIRISSAGMHIPAIFNFFTGFPREVSWTEIDGISVLDAQNNSAAKLEIKRKRQVLRLKLSDMKKEELERFLLSIDLWAGGQSKGESFAGFLEAFGKNQKSLELSGPSFTQLWEEELDQRFSSTAFVPLEPDAELQNGDTRIVRQLSFGGLSAIYLCQKGKRDLYVLKELIVPSDAKPEVREKALDHFNRESQVLCRLEHSNIVKVYDHFVEQGRHYLLLEYVQGLNLRQLVREKGAQSEVDALLVGLAMADVLVYLQEQSPPLIHRDLTPDNIVMKNNGVPVLIDFGAANDFIGKSTGTLVGKQCYMAPEQFRGKAVPASDIYSLGGTLHFLLTGADPEPISSSSPATVIDTIHSSTNDLVRRCTALESSQRPQGAVELKLALEKVLHELA